MAKKRTMNELRQTKEYYKPSQSFIEDQEAAKQLAEKEHLNKVHNKLWGEDYKDEDQEATKQMAEINRQECELDPLEEAKILIVDKITKHFHDVLFEMVCEEMGKHYVFQSQNYLTEAGYEQFEDEWFEFYHEHHGDILYEVMQGS
jgi:hypothetical protein